ncbi:hypothetical protein L5515_005162 [Caenorhabditis briggsae]|uniref:F-box associated domain-containing protein n=1 Tax=Caenorhabditis briggsae TaxID=6238 RepID=A0AAE9EJJ6_CAEBR|nr:hypothetical protein L5515_005162 [Caenorhabditis briggsae]
MGSSPSLCRYPQSGELTEHDNLFKLIAAAAGSKKGKEYVKNLEIRDVTDLRIIFGENGMTLITLNSENKTFEMHLEQTEQEQDVGKLKVNDVNPLLCKFNIKSAPDVIQTTITILMNIFHLQNIRTMEFKDPDRLIHEIADIHQLAKTAHLRITKPTVTSQELKFLKSIRTFFLAFNTMPPDEYHLWPLKFKNVEILNGYLYTIDDLYKNDECYTTKLNLRKCEWSTTSINEFLKIWLESKQLLKFEYIRFGSVEDLGDLFDGLTVLPRFNALHSRYYKMDSPHPIWFDCKTGWDIKRSDDTLATVLFDRDSRCCWFLVWRERFFPDLPEELSNDLVEVEEQLGGLDLLTSSPRPYY